MSLVAETCCNCGIDFGVTASFHKMCQADSERYFYCPNGHSQHYTESETDKLRRERDRLKQENARLDEIRQAAERAEQAAHEHAMAQSRRASAARGQVTRLKNRAANGVCPCCNRTFANLQRHMATKHSGFVAEEIAA